MGDLSLLEQAVDELHEPDRLLDLLVAQLRRDDAPPELVEHFEAGRLALRDWLNH
jgi:hypothetical protein